MAAGLNTSYWMGVTAIFRCTDDHRQVGTGMGDELNGKSGSFIDGTLVQLHAMRLITPRQSAQFIA